MILTEKLILCIDNNASRNLAIYLLKRVGFAVSTANSIGEGIKKAQTQRYDLYLINHKLLGGREIDSCDKLNEFAPRAPILFYSTVLYPYEPIRAIQCRQHGHMVKPVNACDVERYAAKLIDEWAEPVESIQHLLRKSIAKDFAPSREHSHQLGSAPK